jgi:hypothetical protein
VAGFLLECVAGFVGIRTLERGSAMNPLPAPSQEAVLAARDIRREAIVELADLAASYWRSAAEAAYRDDQLFEREEFGEHLRSLQGAVRGDYSALPFASSARRMMTWL